MTSPSLSRGEFANRGFRWGFFAGSFVGLLMGVVFSVVNTVELRRASEEIGGGPVGFLVHVEYLMSYPGGIVLAVGGAGISAMLGGALGIVTGKVLHRTLR